MLGDELLCEIVARSRAATSEMLAREIVESVELYSDGLRDDLEVLILRPV